jgi:hypothetical protein
MSKQTETKPRKFIAVQSGTVSGVYSLLTTNLDGIAVENVNGLPTEDCIEWLCKLCRLRYWKENKPYSLIFVWYGASYDVEMIMKDLPDEDKKAIFQGLPVYYKFNRKIGGYMLRYIKGKFLSVQWVDKNFDVVKGVVLFDLFSFFHNSIGNVCKEFLGETPPEIIDAETAGALWRTVAERSVYAYAVAVCGSLELIAGKLNEWFEAEGIALNRWYGPSAAANAVLTKWKARKQFTPLNKDQTPPTLWQAITSAFFGGRIETLKLGTVTPAFVHDINSAYPYAATLMGRVDGPWLLTREYNDSVMSVWLLEYDLPQDCHIGIIPHRSTTGKITYQRKGRGWYWQPEVAELVARYPENVLIVKGYYQENYYPVTFGKEIEYLYQRREQLQAEGSKAEHCLKMLLVSIYGKFAQRIGSPAFKCLPWAGWITSYTRAQMLKAVAGREQNVIAFCADAIHATEVLPVPQSRKLGDWKVNAYLKGLYVMSGVYHLTALDKDNKQASRGFELIDWSKAIASLNQTTKLAVDRNYFVGYRLASLHPLFYGDDYLRFRSETKRIDPKQFFKRWYDFGKIEDWGNDFCNSQMLDTDNMLFSQPMLEDEVERIEDLAIDYLIARGDLKI